MHRPSCRYKGGADWFNFFVKLVLYYSALKFWGGIGVVWQSVRLFKNRLLVNEYDSSLFSHRTKVQIDERGWLVQGFLFKNGQWINYQELRGGRRGWKCMSKYGQEKSEYSWKAEKNDVMLKKVEGEVNFNIPNGVWVALEALLCMESSG